MGTSETEDRRREKTGHPTLTKKDLRILGRLFAHAKV